MSNINSDTVKTAHTSLSEVSLLTHAYPPPTPREDIENQLPELPEDPKLPSLLQFVFDFFLVRRKSSELLWQQVRRDEDGWEKYFGASRNAIAQITAAQGLVLAANAAFLTTSPPFPSINYVSNQCYRVLSSSFILSIVGLVSQQLLFGASQSLSSQVNQRNSLSHNAFMCYLVLHRIPLFAFVYS
ncbi:hypothetical protein AZE42_07672, partial [Rhizopogon vesiculosus]